MKIKTLIFLISFFAFIAEILNPTTNFVRVGLNANKTAPKIAVHLQCQRDVHKCEARKSEFHRATDETLAQYFQNPISDSMNHDFGFHHKHQRKGGPVTHSATPNIVFRFATDLLVTAYRDYFLSYYHHGYPHVLKRPPITA